MKIKIDGGFISAAMDNDKIGLSIGCEHYNQDGTRKETVVNTAYLTEEQLVQLFSDVFSKEDVEQSENESSEIASEANNLEIK